MGIICPVSLPKHRFFFIFFQGSRTIQHFLRFWDIKKLPELPLGPMQLCFAHLVLCVGQGSTNKYFPARSSKGDGYWFSSLDCFTQRNYPCSCAQAVMQLTLMQMPVHIPWDLQLCKIRLLAMSKTLPKHMHLEQGVATPQWLMNPDYQIIKELPALDVFGKSYHCALGNYIHFLSWMPMRAAVPDLKWEGSSLLNP